MSLGSCRQAELAFRGLGPLPQRSTLPQNRLAPTKKFAATLPDWLPCFVFIGKTRENNTANPRWSQRMNTGTTAPKALLLLGLLTPLSLIQPAQAQTQAPQTINLPAQPLQ